MTHAIRIHETGGPEVMRWESMELNAPEAGEVQVRNTAVGLNYIDTYHRSGLYPLPLPSLLGQEGAGVVESVGSGVSGLRVGDRVAYATGPIGAYCEVRNYPADKLVKLPSGISDEIAATIMLKGMTAEYLLHRTAHVQSGDVILLHAAAGGTGVLVAQWAAEMGVTVIGVVSSEEKAEIARQHGCQHVLISGEDNLAAQVLEITNGKGVKVAYDSVGKDTFEVTIESLMPCGMFVSFGQASGPIPDINLRVFAPKNLYFTRPSLFVYTRTRELLEQSAARLFDAVLSGVLTPQVRQSYALQDAAQAHQELESRKTVGATVLTP
jgi:NADPH2:quinone reductase